MRKNSVKSKDKTPVTTDTDETTTDDDCFVVINLDRKKQKVSQEELNLVEDEADTIVTVHTPLQYALYSRSWDLAVLLVKAGCKIGSVDELMESTRQGGGVLPKERLVAIRKILLDATSTPAPLLDLSRQLIRKCLQRDLVDKVEQLPLSLALQNLLLLHDLFQAPEGRSSFEV